MKLEQIEYVKKIEEFHSINKAAKSLIYSQPLLSASIRQLEEELGYKIFDRNSQGAFLTEKGRKFLEYGEQINELVSKIYDLGSEQNEREKLSICHLHSYYLLELVSKYVQNISDAIELDARENENAKVYYTVRDNPEFVGIAFKYGKGYDRWENFCEENNLEFIELAREKISVAVGRNNPIYNMKTVKYEELSGLEAITDMVLNEKGEYQPTMAEFLKDHFRLAPIVFNNNRSKIFFISRSAKHFGLILEWFSRSDILVKNDEIRFIPIEDAETERSIGIVINRNARSSDLIKNFVNFLIENEKAV